MSGFELERCLSIPGWMGEDELTWLYEQARRFSSVLEVGCWLGRSASALGQGCKGTVYTVDHFAGSPSQADQQLEAATGDMGCRALNNLIPFPNVRVISRPSLHAARTFRNESLDMVFLDGEHTKDAVLTDLIAWEPKCHTLLCGHDRTWDDVAVALALYGIAYECGPGTIWYMEKHG
jgi:hypothetical protein